MDLFSIFDALQIFRDIVETFQSNQQGAMLLIVGLLLVVVLVLILVPLAVVLVFGIHLWRRG